MITVSDNGIVCCDNITIGVIIRRGNEYLARLPGKVKICLTRREALRTIICSAMLG